ncbi:MAG: hypothetical protein WBF43_07330 [Methylocella sp.]
MRVQVLAETPLQELAAAFGELDALAELEGMVVGDDDLGPVHVIELSPGTNSHLA